MDSWALALICTLAALVGIVTGGLSVYIFYRMRERRQRQHGRGPSMPARSTADLCMEEFETQMTEGEKQVMRNISSADGAISLTLKLPDPRLRMPITHEDGSLFYGDNTSHATLPPATPIEYAVSIEAEVPTPDGTSEQGQHSVRSSNEVPIAVVYADHLPPRQSSLVGPGAVGMSPVRSTQLAEALCCTSVTVSASEPYYTHNSGTYLQSASLATAATAFAFALSTATEWTSPAADRRSRQLSIQATIVGDELDECEDAIEEIPDQQIEDTCDTDYEISHVPKYAPYSLIERHIESFRYTNTPASPQTLASPCGSSDYEFVPPSPSISSLYEVTGPEAAISQSSVQMANPRSTGLGKSINSPSGLAGSSLFSPPPVAYHQRYFEAHGMRSPAIRDSSDRTAS
ncbi:hypothetical protein H4R27_004536 [Coemansia aciculifera]|uniref:Uncharacterized protein n=1 Tax=Coemansia pectinata TaxID=1052879 RepID=A0A9W8GWF4_9FUNG|nr:hypothetical protein GGI19_002124 [Coemansia pectinata]KAJ2880733.1 hypothetical protein H4R27_004536 [Coemansia aciculifera]